ncbi:MAG: DUF4248 domain-containing protein [Bacteroides sp.]|nr:DUF4248 domain-containing protein [Bacteroides sp.]
MHTIDLFSEHRPFLIRAYSKGELANRYLPYLPIRSALNTLNYWIQTHPTLYARLQEVGYRKKSKFFSPVQVSLIVEALGEP